MLSASSPLLVLFRLLKFALMESPCPLEKSPRVYNFGVPSLTLLTSYTMHRYSHVYHEVAE